MSNSKGRTFAERFKKPTWAAEGLPETTAPPAARSQDPAQDTPLQVSLALERQMEGEPDHWSIYVAREGVAGMVYQVTGDAECMSYGHSSEPTLLTASDGFKTAYVLADITEEQAAIVKECADEIAPPRAANRAAVRENCQNWAVRVIGALVSRGVVSQAKLDMAVDLLNKSQGR
ncbi:hypothetical protein KEM55_005628 [Ascosphaera atra]|nr:hypothetical protein KEM55_005628 [Ascosphaera atra]